MPCLPGLLQPEPLSPVQATADPCLCRRHSNTQRLARSLVGFLGPGAYKVLFEPSEHLWWVWGLFLDAVSPLLPSYWNFSFALGHGVSFFVWIQHPPVDGCSVVSCNFGILTVEDDHMAFHSTILMNCREKKTEKASDIDIRRGTESASLYRN